MRVPGWQTRVRNESKGGQQPQPTLIYCEGFESSITVGTRKMVNYA